MRNFHAFFTEFFYLVCKNECKINLQEHIHREEILYLFLSFASRLFFVR